VVPVGLDTAGGSSGKGAGKAHDVGVQQQSTTRRVACSPSGAGHADVHEHHVRVVGAHDGDSGRPVAGLADDGDLRRGVPAARAARRARGVVVDEKDADLIRRGALLRDPGAVP
jgi:hypothetical protein